MRNKKLQLNPDKTEGLWLLGPTVSRTMPSLLLDGIALPHIDPVCSKLGVDTGLTTSEQVAVMTRRASDSFVFCTTCAYVLDWQV